MKEFILKTVAKEKTVIKNLIDLEVNKDLKTASYKFVIKYEDFKNNKKLHFLYIDNMVTKFAEYLKQEKKLEGTLLNHKNKQLIKDIKTNGLLIVTSGQVIGLNLIVVNKKKITSHLDEETTTALIEANTATTDPDEAMQLFKKNKKAYNKFKNDLKVGRNIPEYLQFELIGAI